MVQTGFLFSFLFYCIYILVNVNKYLGYTSLHQVRPNIFTYATKFNKPCVINACMFDEVGFHKIIIWIYGVSKEICCANTKSSSLYL